MELRLDAAEGDPGLAAEDPHQVGSSLRVWAVKEDAGDVSRGRAVADARLVAGLAEWFVLERCRQLHQRGGGGEGGDAAAGRGLGAGELWPAADDDSGDPAPRVGDHFRRSRLSADEPTEMSACEACQQGPFAAGKDSSEVVRFEVRGRVAHPVDAGKDSDEGATREPRFDLTSRQPGREQLPARDQSMRTRRHAGDDSISKSEFSVHNEEKTHLLRIRPPGRGVAEG